MSALARGRKDAAAGAGWVELTAAILRGAPALPGSLCRNRPELFDPPAHGGRVPCMGRRIPPSRKPVGVIAGETERQS